jgi:hypothetical protein
MHDTFSNTYPNATPFQAWRAGFREGVKMCLDRGAKPSIHEFKTRVVSRNFDNLCIWQSVGTDAENGDYAIKGARLGTYLTMLTDWRYQQVQDFTQLQSLWDVYGNKDDNYYADITEQLKTRLDLPIVDMSAEQSKFFKHHYQSQFKNKGIMARE